MNLSLESILSYLNNTVKWLSNSSRSFAQSMWRFDSIPMLQKGRDRRSQRVLDDERNAQHIKDGVVGEGMQVEL